jgi:hypothetical protein
VHVQSARERRRAGRHDHPQPGAVRTTECRACRQTATAIRRRDRADRRGRRQRSAAVDRQGSVVVGRRSASPGRRSSTWCASPTSRWCRRSMS